MTSTTLPRNTDVRAVRLADLSQSGPTEFDITFAPTDLLDAQQTLELVKLTKMRFRGWLAPTGGSDWELKAEAGASVVQSCVLTLAPVKTRIDEKIYRLFRKEMPEFEDGSVNEMVLEDFEEPLEAEVDLFSLAVEAVSLALPPYPRADGAELENAVFSGDGVAPMTDEDAKPFASLAALKDNLLKE